MVASSPPIVRRAGPSDVGVVQQISADAYIPAYKAVIGAIPKPAFEDYTPRIQRGEVWILDVDGKAIGVAVLEEQRKGYGAVLLQFAEQRAVAIGVPEIRLYTNQRMERNRALYRRQGFVEVGTRPHPSRAGEVLVDMVRALKPV
jgi:ribosomal protein S18 acetylase RimI-like enzyme